MSKFLLICFGLFFLSGCSLTTITKYNPEAASINAQLGIVYLQRNEVELAKRKLFVALKQAPNDATVHDALGQFFAQTGETVLAEKHFLYAIKQADKNKKGFVWHDYGIFLSQQKRYNEAVEYLRLAAKDINCLSSAI